MVKHGSRWIRLNQITVYSLIQFAYSVASPSFISIHIVGVKVVTFHGTIKLWRRLSWSRVKLSIITKFNHLVKLIIYFSLLLTRWSRLFWLMRFVWTQYLIIFPLSNIIRIHSSLLSTCSILWSIAYRTYDMLHIL